MNMSTDCALTNFLTNMSLRFLSNFSRISLEFLDEFLDEYFDEYFFSTNISTDFSKCVKSFVNGACPPQTLDEFSRRFFGK